MEKVTTCCLSKRYHAEFSRGGTTGFYVCEECGKPCDEEYITRETYLSIEEAKQHATPKTKSNH